jgi:hypothetical protein
VIHYERAPRSGTDSGWVRLVELLFRPAADCLEFRVQPSDFSIQFDEAQAWRSDYPGSLYTCVFPSTACLNGNAGGWLFRCRIFLQLEEIET